MNLFEDAQSDEFFEKYGVRILKALRRIIRAVDIHSRKLKSEFNVTAPQMICLYSLASNESLTLSTLSKDVDLASSTVNGIVDRLEAKKYVKRRRDAVDRRKVFVELTDAGRELTRKAPSLLQDRFSEALRGLPELEQTAIALSLERVVELMAAEALEASPNLVPEAQMTENP